MTSGGNTNTNKRIDGMTLAPTLRIFSFKELKAVTRNFHMDTVLGEGGFGRVYKGWVHEKSNAKEGSRSIVVVKKLNHESMQGFQEWQVIIDYYVLVFELVVFSFRFAFITMEILMFSLSNA